MKSKFRFNSKAALIIYEIILGFVIYFGTININSITYTFLSWSVPSIILLYKLPKYRIKLILSSLIWSIPGSIIIDVLGHYTRAWEYWTNPLFASTGIGFLGIPIESFYWGFSFWLFTVLVYEFYFDKHKGLQFRRVEKVITFALSLVGILAVYVVKLKAVGIFEQFYFLIIVLGSLLNVVLLYKYKKIRVKVIQASLLLFVLGIIVETFSFLYKFWIFPGKAYLYQFNLFEKIMPLEEILWWIVVSMGIILIHEIFVDTQDNL